MSGTAPRPVTLEGLYAELAAIRELLEQLVLAPSPERTWLSIDEAAALIHRTPAAVRLRCRVK